MNDKSVISVWDSVPSPVDVQPFRELHGPSQVTSSDPAQLFSLFFTPDIIHGIVRETNRYAAHCLVGKPTTWTTDEEEMKAYFDF